MIKKNEQITVNINSDLKNTMEEWSDFGGGRIRSQIVNDALKFFFENHTKEEYVKPKKYIGTHTRTTFHIRKDLFEKLDELNDVRGKKRNVINDALETFFRNKGVLK